MALSQSLEVKTVDAQLEYYDTQVTWVPVRILGEERQFGQHRYFVQPYSEKEPRLQGQPRWVNAERIKDG